MESAIGSAGVGWDESVTSGMYWPSPLLVFSFEPYASAHRVFWVVDNGSSHRGNRSAERVRKRWPNLVLVHVPLHASWLNQVEIYFSVIQRKVLAPNDFTSLAEVAERLRAFEHHYEKTAT